MKRIVYTRTDGGTSIVIPCISRDDTGLSEDRALQRALGKDIPADATNVRVVDVVDIPSDRYFRNAWKNDLSVDMPKAREIHKDKLRQLRAPLLAAADVDFMLALERGLPTQAIVASKQALRDVTTDPRIDAAVTPDELKAVVPDVLKEIKV